jgi:SPP1 gp7 family putative phage head morphogenesis protein
MPSRIELARERRIARERFMKARIAERQYQRHLVAVGRHVGDIVRGFADKGIIANFDALRAAMTGYSKLLRPWATAVTERMHAEVSRRDLNAWKQLSRSIGSGLHREIEKTPVGEIRRVLMQEQVTLITSLPIEAAQRVHNLTLGTLYSGERAESVAKEILRSGQVTAARARLIARTETSRTASVLTQARAEFVGSDSYIWRTVQDSDVRNVDGNPIGSHRDLEGNTFRWDDPPVTSTNGKRSAPGCIYNCRCWPEPILPDRIR